MAEYITTIDGFRIEVDKVGGGTLGRAYDGTWLVSVETEDGVIEQGAELTTTIPKTHKEAAEIVKEFMEDRYEM